MKVKYQVTLLCYNNDSFHCSYIHSSYPRKWCLNLRFEALLNPALNHYQGIWLLLLPLFTYFTEYWLLVNGRIFQFTPMGVNNFVKFLISRCHNSESSDTSIFNVTKLFKVLHLRIVQWILTSNILLMWESFWSMLEHPVKKTSMCRTQGFFCT